MTHWDILRCPAHPDHGKLHFRPNGTVNGGPAKSGSGELVCHACDATYRITQGIVDLFKPLSTPGVAAYLEAEAKQWDEQAESYETRRSRDLIYMNCVRAGLRALRPEAGDLILDAGCGTGLGTRLLHGAGRSIVALDLSLVSLQYLGEKVAAPGIAPVRADMSRLPFASKVFDKLICANVLQQLPTWDLRRRCVEQFSRVVKPGGRVVVTAHGFSVKKRQAGWPKEGPAGGTSGKVQYVYRFDVDEFEGLLSQYFRVEKITGAGLPLPYRLKLSSVSSLIEGGLSRTRWSARWGHMLVGHCVVD